MVCYKYGFVNSLTSVCLLHKYIYIYIKPHLVTVLHAENSPSKISRSICTEYNGDTLENNA